MTGTFLDIGANRGDTFDEFLSKYPKYDGWTVWCFEPSPRHLPGLIETASRYKDRYKINICPFGVWSEDGMMILYQKSDPKGDSFFFELEKRQGVQNLETGYQIVTPVKGIMNVLSLGYGSETIIKLDCEGSEYAILERMLAVNHLQDYALSEIYVEFHEIGDVHRSPDDIGHDFERRGLPLKQWML